MDNIPAGEKLYNFEAHRVKPSIIFSGLGEKSYIYFFDCGEKPYKISMFSRKEKGKANPWDDLPETIPTISNCDLKFFYSVTSISNYQTLCCWKLKLISYLVDKWLNSMPPHSSAFSNSIKEPGAGFTKGLKSKSALKYKTLCTKT